MISQEMQDELDWQVFIGGMNTVLDLKFDTNDFLGEHPLHPDDEKLLRKLVSDVAAHAEHHKYNRAKPLKLKGIRIGIWFADELALGQKAKGIEA